MYGLINKSIKDMVQEKYNLSVWAEILEHSGLETDAFISMQKYNDSTTFALIYAASKVLDKPVNDCLEEFGHYWATETCPKSYRQLMDLTGTDLITFLGNLNVLHERITSTFLNYSPPFFEVYAHSESFIIRYVSEREGLLHFVIGLVYGLAEYFSQTVEIIDCNQSGTSLGEVWLIRIAVV